MLWAAEPERSPMHQALEFHDFQVDPHEHQLEPHDSATANLSGQQPL